MTGVNTPTILTLDIETSPHEADVWGLFNQNVGLPQLREPTRTLCWAAKWYEQSSVAFSSEFHDGREKMIDRAWHLMDAADVLVSYNGDTFDFKHLNREFLEAGLGPPSPYQSVDLLRIVKRHFRFASNKLQHVASELGLGEKIPHAGHALWAACLRGDPKAWAQMKRYCKGDVVLEEKLFDRLRPWINIRTTRPRGTA